MANVVQLFADSTTIISGASRLASNVADHSSKAKVQRGVKCLDTVLGILDDDKVKNDMERSVRVEYRKVHDKLRNSATDLNRTISRSLFADFSRNGLRKKLNLPREANEFREDCEQLQESTIRSSAEAISTRLKRENEETESTISDWDTISRSETTTEVQRGELSESPQIPIDPLSPGSSSGDASNTALASPAEPQDTLADEEPQLRSEEIELSVLTTPERPFSNSRLLRPKPHSV